jgi:hypothetical protein
VVKVIVMARKRRAPNYTGALAQPIYPEDHYKFTGGLGQATREPDIAAISKRRVEKMLLLFEHYKLDPSDERSWRKLAVSLALEHVPGLQLVFREKPGPKPKWPTGLGDALVRDVEDVQSQTGCTEEEAIAKVREERGGKWKTFTPQNLGARYREARARQKVLASLHEAWEKGIFFGRLRLPRRRRSGGLTR